MLGMDLKMCLMRKVGIPLGPAERLGFSFSTIFITVFNVTCWKLNLGFSSSVYGRKSSALSVEEIVWPSFTPIWLKKLLKLFNDKVMALYENIEN